MGNLTVSFFVAGTPKPQGSKRAFMRPNAKHPTMVESAGDALKDWRAAVSYAAAKQDALIDGPVRVSLTFRFARPKSHFGTGGNAETLKTSAPEFHIQRPDIDKLTRAVLDALTNITFGDDSCVVAQSARKEWAGKGFRSGCFIEGEPII